MKKFLIRFGTLLSTLALFFALATSGFACIYTTHQPEEPADLERFKK
ncbi:MAG: cyclic lactone autoinducer peptide [Clostridiales bacterium]|nr:cyclic lactone autoinducer peptide [Clostridiales bacterium]